MGQYWDIVNLDRRQQTHLGKLGEGLFDTSPGFLAQSLQRCSIYLADLTHAHTLKSPHSKQAVSSSSSSLTPSRPGAPHVEGTHLSKRSKKIKAAPDTADPEHDVPSKSSNVGSINTPIPYFTSLPTELINLVYAFLPGHIQVLFFALTSRRHWQIGRPHIRSRILALTCWAGERIICVGDGREPGDMPPTLELTVAEKTELREGQSRAEVSKLQDEECGVGDEVFWSDEDEEESERTRPFSLFDLVSGFRRRVQVNLALDVINKLRPRPGICDIRAEMEALQLFDSLTEQPDSERSNSLERWPILRNLSRNEYVHGKTFKEFQHQYCGQHPDTLAAHKFEKIGFGEMVVIRTCWSSDPSIAMRYGGNLHRGGWAGDRFDIVPEGEFVVANKERKWKDLSEEELLAVWESEYTG